MTRRHCKKGGKCQKTYLLIKVSWGDVYYYLVTASVLMEVICCLGSSTPSDAREIGGKKVLWFL